MTKASVYFKRQDSKRNKGKGKGGGLLGIQSEHGAKHYCGKGGWNFDFLMDLNDLSLPNFLNFLYTVLTVA